MQRGHRPPTGNPSDPGAIGCECVDASLPPVAFHAQLHNALRHRRCLSKDPLTRNRAQRVSAKWKRTTVDYGLLAYGILEHTRRGASHIYGHDLHGENATWLEFGVASAGSTNVTCDALQQRFAADHAASTPPRVVGFDTFTGLPEQWGTYMAKGRFSQGGRAAAHAAVRDATQGAHQRDLALLSRTAAAAAAAAAACGWTSSSSTTTGAAPRGVRGRRPLLGLL